MHLFYNLHILNYSLKKEYYETRCKAEKLTKKKLGKSCKEETTSNESSIKKQVGRPHCGIIFGVLPQYRVEIEKMFIEWYEQGYFDEESPTGMKALSDILFKSKLLLSNDEKPLSNRTIEQELGEVYRDLHAKEIKEKKKEKSCKNRMKNTQ